MVIGRTSEERKEIFENFQNAYNELKPKLEDFFEVKIDCPLERAKIPSFFRLEDDKIDPEKLIIRAANMTGASYGLNGDLNLLEKKILVNPYSNFWNGRQKHKYACCHELLHDVFLNFYQGKFDSLITNEIDVIWEGFCEYGTINLLRDWLSEEETWMQLLEEDEKSEFGFSYDLCSEKNVVLISYSSHSIGYLHFLDTLGSNASKDDYTLHVMKKGYESLGEIRSEIHSLVAKIFEEKVLVNGIPTDPVFKNSQFSDLTKFSEENNNIAYKTEYIPSLDFGAYAPVKISLK